MAERTFDKSRVRNWRTGRSQTVPLHDLVLPKRTRREKIRRTLSAGTSVAALITAGYLLSPAHIANTLRVGEAEVGISVSCDNSSNPNGPILIADLGSAGDRSRLSTKEKIRTQAAVDLYLKDRRTGKDVKIGLIDGKMDSPRRQLGYLDWYFHKRTGRSINPADVIVDNQSTDTQTNAERVKAIFDRGNFASVQVDTSQAHMGRAMVAVCKEGVPAKGYPAENELPETHSAKQLLETASLNISNSGWASLIEKFKTLPYLFFH